MSDVMAANPQHYNIGGFSYGTLCNATASPIPPSQMGVCELFNQMRGQIQYERGVHIITYDRLVDNILKLGNGF